MDPTNVPPPSPEKSPSSPPPPNPHTPIDAVIDAPGFDCYQKSESITSRNMDNFRALVLKYAGRLLPAHQSLIERRFDDIFPGDLLVPDHPPYADMILTALWELNTEGGSSEEAISDFIKKEYHELPWAHATMLNHHLRDLCIKGKISMTHDRCYVRCSSITKPIPNPSSINHLSLGNSPSSSPISSPSASLCYSPTSSSSSFGSDLPYQGHKTQLQRKRKKGRVGKIVQVSGSGRGRGRGRGRGKGREHVMIKARRRGRPRKEIKIGEKSQMEVIGGDEDRKKIEETKQVIEDRNGVIVIDIEEDAVQEAGAEKEQNHPQEKNNAVVEVGQNVGQEWNGNVKEKGESGGLRRSGRRKNDVSKEENLPSEKQDQPQKHYNVRWIGRGEHTQVKGCVKQRGSGSKQHTDKEHQPCEQLKEGFKEQDHQRKQCNVVWIGRGVRKLKEADDEVYDVEDSVSEEKDAEVDEHVEQSRKNTEKGETNVEHNQTEENQMHDVIEKHILEKEQDLVTMQCEAQLMVAIQEKQHDDTVEEQIRPEEQPMEDTKEEFQTHEQQNSGNTKQEIPEEQVDMFGKTLQDESNVMTSQHEAQARVEVAEKTEPEKQDDGLTEEQVDTEELSKELLNDVIEEPINPQEQCVERIDEKHQSCGQDDPMKNGEAESDEEQPQHEEQLTEVTQKGIMHVMDTEMQQDLVMNQDETKVSGACAIQDVTQEKNNAVSNQNLESSSSTIEGSISFSCNSLGVEKACLPDHKHQAKQRLPLRQGLRSSCKKEEATPNTKNQLEQVTPVRRSLRPRKTNSETAVITEKGPDNSKEKLKHSGHARPSKRKPKVTEEDQVSKSQKTRKNL